MLYAPWIPEAPQLSDNMVRGLALVLEDPLVSGFWGVFMQTVFLCLGCYLLAFGKDLSSLVHLCIFLLASGLCGLSIWLLTRWALLSLVSHTCI